MEVIERSISVFALFSLLKQWHFRLGPRTDALPVRAVLDDDEQGERNDDDER